MGCRFSSESHATTSVFQGRRKSLQALELLDVSLAVSARSCLARRKTWAWMTFLSISLAYDFHLDQTIFFIDKYIKRVLLRLTTYEPLTKERIPLNFVSRLQSRLSFDLGA